MWDGLPAALSAIDNHHYSVESRLAVRTTLPDGREVTAFNDIALVPDPRRPAWPGSPITVEEQRVRAVRRRRVIVATPPARRRTPSPVGGPILSPTVQGVLVRRPPRTQLLTARWCSPPTRPWRCKVLPTSGRLAVEV